MENISARNIKGLQAARRHLVGDTEKIALEAMSNGARSLLEDRGNGMEEWAYE